MLEAEIATAPETELEPGKFTPPPASIARFCAVSIDPVEVTEPGVERRTEVTFDDESETFWVTKMSPVVVEPNRNLGVSM
jgi:hypothetical protein